MMEQSKKDSSIRMHRPLGVWFLTIYAATFAGLAPLIVAVILLFSGSEGANPVFLIFSIILNFIIIFYAVRTWQGNDRARKIFLLLVTANYVLIGVNNLNILSLREFSIDEQARLYGRILRGVIYPALFIWYFSRSKTKEFFVKQ